MKKVNRGLYAVINLIVMIFAGMIYAWPVMAKSIGATYPDWSAAQLSLTFTLAVAFVCVSVIVVGVMSKRITPRGCILISGVLFLVGFLIAPMTGESPFLLYLGFGIICGLASGVAYGTSMSLMSAWFPDKQGLISGILLMGFAAGAFVIGKVFAAVAPPGDETWRMVFRLFGILICVIFIICSFFYVRPGEDFKPVQTNRKKAVREPASEITLSEMARKPAFWMYYIWAVLLAGAGLILVSQAGGIASQVGTEIAAGTIATVIGLISIMNGVGRLFFGALFDKKGFRLTLVLSMIIFIIGCIILVMALTQGTFLFVILGYIICGFAYGVVTPTNSAIVSDFYGRKNFAMNFALVNTTMLVASLSSTIAGRLYDVTGSFLSCVIMMIAFIIVGAVVSVAVRRPH